MRPTYETAVLVHTTQTPAPPAAPSRPVADEQYWVICRVCYYERRAGEPCGLPCV
jgi:hypothetical protein